MKDIPLWLKSGLFCAILFTSLVAIPNLGECQISIDDGFYGCGDEDPSVLFQIAYFVGIALSYVVLPFVGIGINLELQYPGAGLLLFYLVVGFPFFVLGALPFWIKGSKA